MVSAWQCVRKKDRNNYDDDDYLDENRNDNDHENEVGYVQGDGDADYNDDIGNNDDVMSTLKQRTRL